MTDDLFFKLEYTIQRLRIPDGVTYRFEYGGPHLLTVLLMAPSPEEQARGHDVLNAFCTSTGTFSPNKRVLPIFGQIAANDVLAADAAELDIAMEYTDPGGRRIRVPAFSRFPRPFRDFLASVQTELADIARRTIATLRWRVNEPGPHDPISTRGLSWSLDRAFWHPAPSDTQVRLVDMFGPLFLSDDGRQDVLEIVATGSREPLHHELFREAWAQRLSNPRSAVVIGIAAGELGIKRCIAELVPNAEWIVMNLPTPPVTRMLREYLPTLPGRNTFNGRVKPPPPDLLATLDKGIALRNGLAHAGRSNVSADTAEDVLNAVRDLLWLMDYYTGFRWAVAFLRESTRHELEAA